MKTIIIILFLFVFFQLTGQDTVKNNWYIGINAGYAVGMQKTVIDETVKASATVPSTKSYEKDYLASLGKGFYNSLILGYQIDSYSFFEFTVGYSISDKLHFSEQIFHYGVDSSPFYTTETDVFGYNIHGSLLYGLQKNLNSKWNFFAKSGVVSCKSLISAQSVTKTYGYSPISSPGFELKYQYQYKSALGIGFSTSAGIEYKINQKFSITGSTFMQLLGLRMLSRDLVAYTVDGQNNFQDIKEDEKHKEYFNGRKINTFSTDELNGKNQPLTIKMNSFGFNIGALYHF